MTCPNCKCPTCKAAAVNAVLGKIVSRETVPVETENARALSAGRLHTILDHSRPAEQLATDVVREMGRAG